MAPLAPGEFRLTSEPSPARHTIILEGELDLASADQLQEALQAAELSDTEEIVLDLSQLTFIDSTGVALLVEAIKHSQQNAGRLRIRRSASAGVQRVLEMTGIDDHLPYLDGDVSSASPDPAA